MKRVLGASPRTGRHSTDKVTRTAPCANLFQLMSPSLPLQTNIHVHVQCILPVMHLVKRLYLLAKSLA